MKIWQTLGNTMGRVLEKSPYLMHKNTPKVKHRNLETESYVMEFHIFISHKIFQTKRFLTRKTFPIFPRRNFLPIRIFTV
jgi:hypothetical protein